MSNQSNFRTEIKRKHSINFLVQTQDDMIFEGRCAKDVNNFLKIWYQFHLCNYNHFDFLNFRRLFCLLQFFRIVIHRPRRCFFDDFEYTNRHNSPSFTGTITITKQLTHKCCETVNNIRKTIFNDTIPGNETLLFPNAS